VHKSIIIGAGARGLVWAKALQQHPEFQLVGIVDPNSALLAERGDALAMAKELRHERMEDAIPGAQAAFVVVPHHLHYPVARQVLEAGLHCLVEKPFTLLEAEAKELVELAASKNLVLQVAQNYRLKPVCLFVEKVLREQRLGRLCAVQASFHRNRPPRQEHEARMPWPLLYTQVIHHLDWLTVILPAPIAEVASFHSSPPWSGWENPSVCQISLRCEDDTLVSYSGSYEARGEASSYSGSWRFECERGDLHIGNPTDTVWEVTENGASRTELFTDAGKATEQILLTDLHRGIVDGIEPPTSGRRNLETMALLFRVMQNGPAHH